VIDKPAAMQGRKQKISAAIAGENSAGAVGPVRAGGKAQYPDRVIRIADPLKTGMGHKYNRR